MEMLEPCDVHVPGHWHVEVGNMLLMGRRRERVSDKEFAAALDGLRFLAPQIDETGGKAWNEIFELAARHDLTLYDAAYLELAVRRGAWLASDDKALLTAARKEGVETRTSLS